MAMNPTGLSDAMATTNWGGTPKTGGPAYPTGGPGTYNFGNTMNPNPTVPGTSAAPTVSMTPGQSGTAPFNPTQFGQGSDPKNLRSKLSDIFGSGLGPLIQDFLQKGQGGYNDAIAQQAVGSTIQGMQRDIYKGFGDLQNVLGSQGVSPFSSVNALESSFYMSDAVAKENAITAQMFYDMWNQAEGRQYGLLGEVAQAGHQHQGNAGDWAGQFAAVGQGIGSLIGGAGYTSSSGGGFTL